MPSDIGWSSSPKKAVPEVLNLDIRYAGDRGGKGVRAKRAPFNRLTVTEAYQIAHAFNLCLQLTNLCKIPLFRGLAY